jgi:hypothetical protein
MHVIFIIITSQLSPARSLPEILSTHPDTCVSYLAFLVCFLLSSAPFGCADKPAEKHCWLICCERKILFQLKKQAEKDGL